MGNATTDRVALMAIHPIYADAILAGSKLVEFRKRPLATDIQKVLIYATSPTQMVIGEFTIRGTVIESPESIWDRFGSFGEIERDDFFSYYRGSDLAVAILIDAATRYEEPQNLNDYGPKIGIPQSFSYLRTLAPALS